MLSSFWHSLLSIHTSSHPPTHLPTDRPSSVHPSTHPSIHAAIFLSIYPFIHLPTPPSFYLHIFLSIHPSIHPSIYSPIFLCVYQFIISLSFLPSTHSSIGLPCFYSSNLPPTHPSSICSPIVCHSYTHWSISLSSLPLSTHPSIPQYIHPSIHPPIISYFINNRCFSR